MHKSVLIIAVLVLGLSGVATADTVELNEKPCFHQGSLCLAACGIAKKPKPKSSERVLIVFVREA